MHTVQRIALGLALALSLAAAPALAGQAAGDQPATPANPQVQASAAQGLTTPSPARVSQTGHSMPMKGSHPGKLPAKPQEWNCHGAPCD